MKNSKSSKLFKLALLSISLYVYIGTSISPAASLLYQAFGSVSHTQVDLLTTIPNFGIVLGLILSPFAVKAFGQKKIIISGLLLTLICGLLPAFLTNFWLILATRFLVGLGIGLFNSLAVSLIPQLYHETNELSKMVGYQTLTASLGSALSLFIVAFLVSYGWHAVFWMYLMVLPGLLLFVKAVELPQTASQKTFHWNLPLAVWIMALLMFLVLAFYMTLGYKLPIFAVEKGFVSTSTYSMLAGCMMLVGLPVGAIFGRLYDRFKSLLLPASALILFAGFLVISLANNLPVLLVGDILAGIGYGLIMPVLYRLLDRFCPHELVASATTLVLISGNIGCSFSPILLEVLGGKTAQAALLISAGFFAILFMVSLIYAVGRKA
ncbi:MFS transporter [Lactobacillus corticis]|uniref:Major facilitator superfamily transporter n=1 Tax=Lactobacillus corticis TaxID=2201249 RepID=A0A916QL20_9LACO|nr:MFS transporter [Lactobacillus corticis]GFZ27456.1 major facilitator superfamily transporter [Lactobacillus corticis]